VAERPVQFGSDGHLVGVLSLPAEGRRSRGDLACLMLNVGVTHRIGPRRVNVKLARQLAEQGVASLRFDLSGIGDSDSVRGRLNFREQALRDMQAAMDMVEAETGIRRFAVIGICSGAVNGYWLAQVDPRVAGLMMFDGFAYTTLKTRLVHDWLRLRTTPWRTVLQKVKGRLIRSMGAAPANQQVSIFNVGPDEATPTRAEFAAALNGLAQRGVALYMIYSGSLLLHFNYAAQTHDVFGHEPFIAGLRHDYWPQVDHLATSQASQRQLLDATCDWIRSIVSTPTPSAISTPSTPDRSEHAADTARTRSSASAARAPRAARP